MLETLHSLVGEYNLTLAGLGRGGGGGGGHPPCYAFIH